MENKVAEKLADMNAGSECAQAVREKRFGECGLEEKVERLRNVLSANEHRLDSISQLAVEAHELAHEHQHDSAGRVMRAARDMVNKLLRGVAGRNRSALD